MKRTGYIVIAFVSILALSVGGTGALGLDESHKGHGAQGGGKVSGPVGVKSIGGGNISHIAPSVSRSSFNKFQSSGHGAQGGGLVSAPAGVRSLGSGNISRIASSARGSSFSKLQSSGQYSKPTGGQFYKPAFSGQGSSFAPTGKKIVPQGLQSTGQAWKGKPTSSHTYQTRSASSYSIWKNPCDCLAKHGLHTVRLVNTPSVLPGSTDAWR